MTEKYLETITCHNPNPLLLSLHLLYPTSLNIKTLIWVQSVSTAKKWRANVKYYVLVNWRGVCTNMMVDKGVGVWPNMTVDDNNWMM